MKKIISLLLVGLLLIPVMMTACSQGEETSQDVEFKYYSAEKVKESIENDEEFDLVDIQVQEEYDEHHIAGAIETNAYPVKEDTDKAKIDAIYSQLEGKENPIVIVCPRGAGGAERTYKYLLEKGINEDRLFILEDGQAGWPYEDLLAK
ncbi:rhodanese-like domain-containing protein [Sporosalibacterium faouarense]|uniref:rhodanese-like domain-containing protein n=1 Tax=Sporosalibacterium faouarense TaxID=516123 RepID=UPI00141CB066|nr:rhodanese-like domain-containing protein [Sporosalibacterium faouarense]MTI48760.1 rhodanese-like domain-containing protein [Bacillota bacterium]